MRNEILDELENNDYPKYGIKSFNQFLYSMLVILFFVGVILYFSSPLFGIMGGTFFFIAPLLLLLSVVISNILGLKNALKSKQKKERAHWKKKVGVIGNIILGLFFLLILFIFSMDIYQVL